MYTSLFILPVVMKRTQIYLSEDENSKIQRIAKSENRSKSDIIREAIDSYLIAKNKTIRKKQFKDAFGIWKDRDDLPDYNLLRKELDRE